MERLRVLIIVAVAIIVGGALWASGLREQSGKDAEARADAAAAQAEAAAARAQSQATVADLLQACSRTNERTRRTNALAMQVRGFFLDAADIREKDGDLEVADNYRSRALKVRTYPLLDCGKAFAGRTSTKPRASMIVPATPSRTSPSAPRASVTVPASPRTSPVPRPSAPRTTPRATPAPRSTPPAAPSAPAAPSPTPAPTPPAPAPSSPSVVAPVVDVVNSVVGTVVGIVAGVLP